MLKKILRTTRAKIMRFLIPSGTYLKELGIDPVSNAFGFDRGKSVDRYYIENFVKEHADTIKGNVLEVQDDTYTKRYGGEKITGFDVLDILPENKKATIIGDLRDLSNTIADNTYDSLIITQTLHLIGDYESCLRECLRVLKPGGVLLATQPCLSRIDPDSGPDIDSWRMTPAGVKYMFSKVFDPSKLEIKGHGNAIIGAAFWLGLSQEEVSKDQLDKYDPMFPCIVTIKATK